jgi:uncharacterized YigZ family protein
MPENLVPAARFHHESWVKNSHFIASISPSFTVEQARAFIAEISQMYSDASHHVPAYIIGFGSSIIEHASDAGEPAGTAGRPALSVLKGSGLGDTVLVITRYFGGTKLGTGGLVKAYSQAARYAVEQVPKAEKINTHRVSLFCHYGVYDQMMRLITSLHGFNLEQDFTDRVKLQLSLPSTAMDHFRKSALDLTKGSADIEILAKNQPALKPVHEKPS